MLSFNESIERFKNYWNNGTFLSGDFEVKEMCNELEDKVLIWVMWSGPKKHPEWNELEKMLHTPLDVVDGFVIHKDTGKIEPFLKIYDNYSEDDGKKIDISSNLK